MPILLRLSVISLLLICVGANAADENISGLIEMEAVKMPHVLKYSASRLYPITKVSTFYSQSDGTKHNKYKDFFYSKCHSIGMRMHHSLDLKEKIPVSIELKNIDDKNDQQEICASADAIIHIFLDLVLNDDYPGTVVVPSDAFDSLINGFSHFHFFSASDPRVESYEPGTIAIKIRDDSNKKNTTVYFSKDK